jgi:hypothetical protein
MLWLATQALGLLMAWWPATLGILIGVIAAARVQGPPDEQELRSLPSVLCLFPVLILVWGSLARFDDSPASPGAWRASILVVVLLLQLAATTAVVYVSRRHRWYAASLGAAIGWFAAACAYLSWMAVTGMLEEPSDA